MKRLHRQAWYQFAELVAGLAGLPLDKLVYTMQTPTPQPPRADPGLGFAGDMQDGRYDRPDEANDRPADREAFTRDEMELAEALGVPSAVVAGPVHGTDVAGRMEAARIATWLDGPRITGTVFFAPAYTANREAAMARIRAGHAGLAGASESALMTSPLTRVWFATMVASLMNVGQFVAGRAPLRGGDYDKYVDRIDEAMMQLRRITYDATTKTFSEQRRRIADWTPYDTPEMQQRLALGAVRRLTLGTPGYR